MKKGFISVLLIVAMLFTLASCGAKASDEAMNFAPGAADGADGGKFFYNTAIDAEMIESVEGVGATADDAYGKFIENQFILTEKENISTF